MLPLYFKHDNLRSFIRQLNIYGFQRCPNASGRDRTMEFFHPMFTRNGARNLKDIKRGNQSQKQQKTEPDVEPPAAAAAEENASEQPPAKKPRVDYSAFKMDVARLQKNLEARRRRAARAAAATARAHARSCDARPAQEFERDLKDHTVQVQQKLAYILAALDEPIAAR